MPTLKITATQAGQAITIDLSGYLKLNEGDGADPYDPAYTQRVFARSLLKEGATLALQQLVEKEQTWPLLLGPFNSQSAMALYIEQLNQIIGTPGAVVTWQDDGMSQPTYFDLLSGELQVEYSYRKAQKAYTPAKLLLFSQPLGRTAGPRAYAAASGVGPLLMISPYASGGALIIGQSTQAGVSGYGGAPMGASSGVFYAGAPSLAGDAAALLQVSYVGPMPNGASNAGQVPYVAVSLLPDQNYRPLITAPEMAVALLAGGVSRMQSSTAVASQYISVASGGGLVLTFNPQGVQASSLETLAWAGQHRLFAIARASQAPRTLQTIANPLVPYSTVASVSLGDWGVYDLGTFSLRASEARIGGGVFPANDVLVAVPSGIGTLDLTALAMLPDSSTWFLNPIAATASTVYQLAANQNLAVLPYSSTLLLDDVLADQFLYNGQSQTSAPSPLGLLGGATPVTRITQYTRGLVPRPDPKNGPPIIAVLGVGQNGVPSSPLAATGASWANPQNLRTMAQVTVLERTRYVLP